MDSPRHDTNDYWLLKLRFKIQFVDHIAIREDGAELCLNDLC